MALSDYKVLMAETTPGVTKNPSLPCSSLSNGSPVSWETRLEQIRMVVTLTFFFYDWVSNGNPLQYSCLENPMDRGAWRAAVHGVPNSMT